MPPTPKRSARDVIVAIAGSWGIKTIAARKLGVARQTFDSYVKRWPSVKAALVDEAESALDMAETNVVKALLGGCLKTAKWYLMAKGGARGYGRPADFAHLLPSEEAITEVAWRETNVGEDKTPIPTPTDLGVPGLSRSDLGLPPEEDK